MKGAEQLVAPPPVAAMEESDKDKRRRRRPNRRSKQSSDSLSNCCGSLDGVESKSRSSCGGGGGGFVGDLVGLEKRSGKEEPLRASRVAFSSLPNMGVLGQCQMVGGGVLRSCPLPGLVPCAAGATNGASVFRQPQGNGGCGGVPKRKYFAPHWTEQVVNEAVEKGFAFRAVLRVNAHNRLEAYCTVDGLPVDVLINGAAAQNRVVEGDIVAIVLDPVASWTRLRGSDNSSNSVILGNSSTLAGEVEWDDDVEDKINVVTANHDCTNSPLSMKHDGSLIEKNANSEVILSELVSSCSPHGNNGHNSVISEGISADDDVGTKALEKLCDILSSYPYKRPTGRVVAIIERSHRRNTVTGFLSFQQGSFGIEVPENQVCGQLSRRNQILFPAMEFLFLMPTDPKFPDMMISVTGLPRNIREKLDGGDPTVKMELIAAQIDNWSEDSLLPQARVLQTLGQGREVESQISAILFENAICKSDFPSETLSCLPDAPWKIPLEEKEKRSDLRHLCIFTIDPSSAVDLDDALSIERLSDDIYRVGVHIADVSHFVLPDTVVDTEAQIRSTSVYVLQHKLPMLPPRLSEDFGSLMPGVDRLAFSMIWDINIHGGIIKQWIGHSVICSCCKLSYECAQDIIDGTTNSNNLNDSEATMPFLHGQFEWKDIVWSVINLHKIAKRLRENRFKDGALSLNCAKLSFLLDECGTPYKSILCETKDSNFLVEEFMLLANKTAAEVISRTFPECALLRRHPKPNLRKLKEFRAFCMKLGFDVDVSSSSKLHISLSKMKEKLKDDPVLFDVLVSYASKPMQLAAYFCTGDLRNREDEWAHYSLAVPVYTHFTSPLRRYPDIIAHRTLSAVVEAEEMYLQQRRSLSGETISAENVCRCFTGVNFDNGAFESKEGREALSAAALKYKVPITPALSEITAYCNERAQASKRAEEAGNKVYLWDILRKKEVMISDARVMGLGPKFMSVYIHKLGIERRIYYSEVEGLIVEWLETTSTLVLDLFRNKRSQRRGCPGRFHPLEDVALVMNPFKLGVSKENSKAVEKDPYSPCLVRQDTKGNHDTHPAAFPLTLSILSAVPVVLHAVGGDDGPPDIAARLYMCSYFR